MNIEISGKVSSILAHKKASPVWSIGPNSMVFDAIRLMDEKNVGALPVVDNKTLGRSCFRARLHTENHREGKVLQGYSREWYND